jgi:hypothetical protein
MRLRTEMIVSARSKNASITLWACARKNCAEVGSGRRGAGSIAAAFRILGAVEAPIW